MSDRPIPARESANTPAAEPRPTRKRYEAPRLVDYGAISKLTLGGGVTVRDNGNMFARLP